MADRMKPNRVRREDADEVFIATATEPLRRKGARTPLHMTQNERDTKNRIAQEIVDEANAKKKK